jgi:hypothetical protein
MHRDSFRDAAAAAIAASYLAAVAAVAIENCSAAADDRSAWAQVP